MCTSCKVQFVVCICRCCCCLPVVLHIHNSLKLTNPIDDVFFLFSNSLLWFLVFQAQEFWFPEPCWVSFSSRTLHVLSISNFWLDCVLTPTVSRARACIPLNPFSYLFWIPQTVKWSMHVTKFGRPGVMMPVPIVDLFIRGYLANWPFYLSEL